MVKWQLLLLLGNADDLNSISAEGKNANQISSSYKVNTILQMPTKSEVLYYDYWTHKPGYPVVGIESISNVSGL